MTTQLNLNELSEMLDRMNLTDLQALEKMIPDKIRRRRAEAERELSKEIREMIIAKGFDPDTFLGKADTPSAIKRTVPVKFRHPTIVGQEWTGRGRQPQWITAHLNGGGTMEELLVSKPETTKPEAT